MLPLRSALLCCSLVVFAASTGCSASRATMNPGQAEVITVEGRVSVRGNEPFTAVVLETESGNWYVLDLTPEQRTGLVNPSIQRVTGNVETGDWNGRPFAHLRVSALERVNR